MLKLLAIAAAILTGAPALAAPRDAAPPIAHVQVADLDLRTPAGVDRLDRRLRQAIARVCPAPAPANLRTVGDHRLCMRMAQQTAAAGRQQVIARAADQRLLVAVNAR